MRGAGIIASRQGRQAQNQKLDNKINVQHVMDKRVTTAKEKRKKEKNAHKHPPASPREESQKKRLSHGSQSRDKTIDIDDSPMHSIVSSSAFDTDQSSKDEDEWHPPGQFSTKYEDDFRLLRCKYIKSGRVNMVKLANTSLCCKVTNESRFRRRMVNLVHHGCFNNFILCCILLNTICMAMFDYEAQNKCIYYHKNDYHQCPYQYVTRLNFTLSVIGNVFGVVFALESCIKIFAMGFIVGKGSFMRDWWNVIDIAVVISWVFEVITQFFPVAGINLRPLRALRLLRPLKAMKTVPSLRKQISALLLSIKGLLNVIAFILMVLLFFSILGLTLFVGNLSYTCRSSAVPDLNSKVWPAVETPEYICSPGFKHIFSDNIVDYNVCPSDFGQDSICGSVLDYNLNQTDDGLETNSQVQFGIGSFNNFGQSLLAVFQIITLDNWSLVLYNQANGSFMPLLPQIFCIGLVLLGNYFMLNLMLAVVFESYCKSEMDTDKEILEDTEFRKSQMIDQADLQQLQQNKAQKSQAKPLEENKTNKITPVEVPVEEEKQVESLLPELNIPKQNSQKASMIEYMKQVSLEEMTIEGANRSPMKNITGTEQDLMGSPKSDDIQFDSGRPSSESSSELSQPATKLKMGSFKRTRNENWVDITRVGDPLPEISPLPASQLSKIYSPESSPGIRRRTSKLIKSPRTSKLIKSDARSSGSSILPEITENSNNQSPLFPQWKSDYNSNEESKHLTRTLSAGHNEFKRSGTTTAKVRTSNMKESGMMINLRRAMRKKVQSQYSQIKILKKQLNLITDKRIKKELNEGILDKVGDALAADNSTVKTQVQQSIQIEEKLIQLKHKKSSLNYKISATNRSGNEDQSPFGVNMDQSSNLSGMQSTISKSIAKNRPNKFNKFARRNALTAAPDIDAIDDTVALVALAVQKQQVLLAFRNGIKAKFVQSQAIRRIANEGIDIIETDKMVLRAKKNCLYRICLKIVQSNIFLRFINLVIVINTLLLSLDHHPMDESFENILEKMNLVLTFIFIIEMFIKLLGMGFGSYFKDSANILDFVIVMLSLGDIGMFLFFNVMSSAEESDTTKTLAKVRDASTVFRIFRLARILKLAKSWSSFNYFLITIGATITKMSSFAVILFLFIFIFAIMGMEFFAQRLRFDFDSQPILQFKEYNNTSILASVPASNFDTFLNSMVTVFIVLSNDGWTPIYWDYYRAIGKIGTTAYFHVLVVFGQWILVNLFLAILLKEFDQQNLLNDTDDEIDSQLGKKPWYSPMYERMSKLCVLWRQKRKQGMISRKKAQVEEEKIDQLTTPMSMTVVTNMTDVKLKSNMNSDQQGGNSSENDEDDEGGAATGKEKLKKKLEKEEALKKQKDISLNLFSTENQFRKYIIMITGTDKSDSEPSNKFENFILYTIVVSSIALTFESPLNEPKGQIKDVLQITDYITTAIFVIESLSKVIASGFFFNGPKSYLKNPNNLLDFCIVVPSVIELFPLGTELGFFKIMRMVRLLRPLRVIGKNANLKNSIMALYVALPAIFSLLIIVLLVMLVFAIMAVNIFKGKSNYCNTDFVDLNPNQMQYLINTKEDCLNYGGIWLRYDHHFDNCWNAVLQMYIMSQAVNWALVMYRTMDGRGPDLVPGYKEQSFAAGIFFVAVIFILSLFIMNLFVGVVITAFNKERDKLGKNFLLTADQQKIFQGKIHVLKMRPRYYMMEPDEKWRKFFFHIAEHPAFEVIILTAIAFNSLLMCFTYPNMHEDIVKMIARINYVFLGFFLIEATVKLIAYGRRYFKDEWNRFDFIIILASIAAIIITTVSDIKILAQVAQLLRIFRLMRLFKLFKNLKTLQIIFMTVVNTLPSILNVGLLMFLIVFIYAVLGINLFATVKNQSPLNKRLNFENFSNAFVTLIRICTGEAWSDLMEVLSRPSSSHNFCKTDPTFQDFKDNGYQTIGCGASTFATKSYFVVYTFLIAIVFMNLFIAIILDGYFEAVDQDAQVLTPELTNSYLTAWSKFDHDATGNIDIAKISDLMLTMGEPLGWNENFKNNEKRQKKSIEMIFNKKIPEEIEFYMFLDKVILLHVVRQSVEQEMRQQEEVQRKSIVNARQINDLESVTESDSSSEQSSNSNSQSQSSSQSESESESKSESGPKNEFKMKKKISQKKQIAIKLKEINEAEEKAADSKIVQDLKKMERSKISKSSAK